MVDAALDWLADISFDGVPGVPGVPSRFSAISQGTPTKSRGVPGVPPGALEHLGTPAEHLIPTHKSLKSHVEHHGTPGTPKNTVGARNSGAAVSTFPPPDIARGMAALRSMPPPRGVDRAAWARAIADAEGIVSDGWATRALALGWAPVDLFGVEPAGSDDDYRYGLAAWLAGRPLVLLDADCAIARDDNHRFVFNRGRDRSGCVLLWELGK